MFSAEYLRSRGAVAWGEPTQWSRPVDLEAWSVPDEAAAGSGPLPSRSFVDPDASFASGGSPASLRATERQAQRRHGSAAAARHGALYRARSHAPEDDDSDWLPDNGSAGRGKGSGPSSPSALARRGEDVGVGANSRAAMYAARAEREDRGVARSPRLGDGGGAAPGNDLASWPRASLEARVRTLERLLAESGESPTSSATRGGAGSSAYSADTELSHHLQVAVRKNRELRAELELVRAQNEQLRAERERVADKLARDHERLASAVADARAHQDALASLVRALAQEKEVLAARLADAERVLAQERAATTAALTAVASNPIHGVRALLPASPGASAAGVAGVGNPAMSLGGLDLKGSLDDVELINGAIEESLRALRSARAGGGAGGAGAGAPAPFGSAASATSSA